MLRSPGTFYIIVRERTQEILTIYPSSERGKTFTVNPETLERNKIVIKFSTKLLTQVIP